MARRSRTRPESDPDGFAFRIPENADPDHHLWRNGRLWWIAFTVHQGVRQERIRLSLRTDDVCEARARRDEMLELFARAEDLNVSLRFQPRRRAG